MIKHYVLSLLPFVLLLLSTALANKYTLEERMEAIEKTIKERKADPNYFVNYLHQILDERVELQLNNTKNIVKRELQALKESNDSKKGISTQREKGKIEVLTLLLL